MVEIRNIEYQDIKLKIYKSATVFYREYLERLETQKIIQDDFEKPKKKYEIVNCNIFGGKMLLLDTKYIKDDPSQKKEIYFNYNIAYEIYQKTKELNQLFYDKYNGYNNAEEEIEDLEIEISKLQEKDDMEFKRSNYDYEVIINSKIYKEYLKLIEENDELKQAIKKLNGGI